jgi:two-component system chemotaxis response regulator CheB
MQHVIKPRYDAIVIGVSAGGVGALKLLLSALPHDMPIPIMIVQHVTADADYALPDLLNQLCAIHVKEAEECEAAEPATIYLAPPNYHLLIESDRTFSLSIDPPVCFARPSIDVLFESAAHAYGSALIGIVLTGANHDGSQGLKLIKQKGGLIIVQDPDDADMPDMPRAAIETAAPDYTVTLQQLAPLLVQVVCQPGSLVPKS